MPKTRREQLTAFLALEILIEGLSSDVHNLRKLPFSPALVTRVIRALQDVKVIDRISHGKYVLNDDFLASVSTDVLPRMRRGGIHYPAMTIFDICGMGEWNDLDFGLFLQRLKNHRSILQAKKKLGDSSWSRI